MGWWKKHLPFPLIYICVLIPLWTVSRNRGWSCKHECKLKYTVLCLGLVNSSAEGKWNNSRAQRPAEYMHALGVCCCPCWLSYGEEGCMFFFFRIAYQADGEEETTVEKWKKLCLSRRQFELADPFLYNFWNPGVVERQWSYVLHTTWETFILLLQQFPDTITAAEEWIRQKVRVVGVLTLPHWSHFWRCERAP